MHNGAFIQSDATLLSELLKLFNDLLRCFFESLGSTILVRVLLSMALNANGYVVNFAVELSIFLTVRAKLNCSGSCFH